MQELVNVATCETPDEALAAALLVGRRLAGVDAMLGAVQGDDGVYTMQGQENVSGEALLGITISGGIGLGGRVLGEGRAVGVEDYTTETSITGHYKQLVAEADLHGIACAAARVPGGPGVLVYGARSERGTPGGRTVEALERVAEAAALSLHRLADRRRALDLEVLRERQRIACSLHDSVAQMLFAIGVSAQQSQRERDPDVLTRALSDIETTAAGARAELRDVFARLSEPLPGLALDAVLEAEARLFRRTGCHVVVTGDGEPRPLTDLAQALIADVAREGLRNACKHGDARLAVLHVGYEPGRIVLGVQAEGGAGVAAAPAGFWTSFPSGSGLDILRRRAEQLGGTLSLTVGEPRTAVLRLELP